MFRFNFDKTLQATATLLRAEPTHIMGRTRLIKLLYIADRRSLLKTGAPITGDRVFARKSGPVLIGTYGLIKGQHPQAPVWSEHFVNEGWAVQLIVDPGTGCLSKCDIEILNGVSEDFRDADGWDMAKLTHTFPEWKRGAAAGGGGWTPITYEDILEALGRSNDIESIRENAEAAANILRV